jgi:WD40 repeat protein
MSRDAPTTRWSAAAADLAADLERFLNGEPVRARSVGLAERCWKWARRRPTTAALVAVSALAALTVLAGWLYFTDQLRLERNAAVRGKDEADRERRRAEQNEAEARRQEEIARTERQRAEQREAVARRYDGMRRSLLAAQLWRVAGLWDRDPQQALTLTEDESACPSDLRDFAWAYYYRLCLQWQPQVVARPEGGCCSVAVSADGAWMAAGCADGTIRLWDKETGRILRGHVGRVDGLAFRPDGKTLASAGADGTVRLWDVAALSEFARLEGHRGEVRGLAFSPDGHYLVSGGGRLDPRTLSPDRRWRDGELWLWDVVAHTPVRRLLSSPEGVLCLAFAPEGRSVACGTSDSSVRVIDVGTGEETARFRPQFGWVHRVAYSPDGRTLAWATAGQVVHLGDLGDGKVRTLRGHQAEVLALAWSPDGTFLASGDTAGQIKVWSARGGREEVALPPESSAVAALAYLPHGGTVVSASRGGVALRTVRVSPFAATVRTETVVGSPVLSPDGNRVVAATQERTIRWLDLRGGGKRDVPLGDAQATALAFAPSGKLLAVGLQSCDAKTHAPLPDGGWRFLDPTTGQPTEMVRTERAVSAVAFTPNGKLVTGESNGQLRLWDPALRKEVAYLGSQGKEIVVLAVSADGRTLASGGVDGSLILWDLDGRIERARLQAHSRGVTGLVFVGDAGMLASVGSDGTIQLWDATEARPLGSLPRQSVPLLCLAASPDGRMLAVGRQDRTVQLWDVAGGQLRAVLTGHSREVAAVAFRADGRALVSVSAVPRTPAFLKGGEIKVWLADEERVLPVRFPPP